MIMRNGKWMFLTIVYWNLSLAHCIIHKNQLPNIITILQEKLCDAQDAARRVIHKTCSADAAMMMSEVLPIDPQEVMKNKHKSSM